MAYRDFAYFYDALNVAADYDALTNTILRLFRTNGLEKGLVADLGCGTGEVSLRLGAAGYEMLCVDASSEMLSVFREKLPPEEQENYLLLNQDISELDLYGTVSAVTSTFDTLNHVPPQKLENVFKRVALFLEPGGLFTFDVNTPYKHETVLGNSSICIEPEPGLTCTWENKWQNAKKATEIHICIELDGKKVCEEKFEEFCYTDDLILNYLQKTGFVILDVMDGEHFGRPEPKSQRLLYLAKCAK